MSHKPSHSKAAADNRANQLNPQHSAHYQSRGVPPSVAAANARTTQVANETRTGDASVNPPTGDNSAPRTK